MDNYFEDLYRYVTSETIVSGVSQTSSNAGVKNVTAPKPTAPKEEPTVIEAAIIEHPAIQQQGTLDEDINALAQHYGILQKGQTIEIGLRDLLVICPRPKRPRSDAFNTLIRKLREEHGVELVIVSTKSNNKTNNLKQDEIS